MPNIDASFEPTDGHSATPNSYHVTSTDVDDDLFRKRGFGPCISKSPRVWACQQCQSIAFR